VHLVTDAALADAGPPTEEEHVAADGGRIEPWHAIVPTVERRIDLSNLDLDRAAVLIADRVPLWLSWGLTVSPPTWMDNEAEWPRPLLVDRQQVRNPMSLGLQVEGPELVAFAQFVLYAGGWADADHLSPGDDDVVSERVELDDAEDFGPLLDRIISPFAPKVSY
jgi:hypothetical protein